MSNLIIEVNPFSAQLRLPNADTFLHCPAYFQTMHLNTFLAQAAAPANGTTGQPSQPAWLGFAPMILLVVVFYFILIRPQQKRAKALAALVSSIKAGDKVVTASGIIGTVITVKDKTVTLRSADTKMEVTKASVTEILEGAAAAEA
jgi:preprotein translocase subunit YajC